MTRMTASALVVFGFMMLVSSVGLGPVRLFDGNLLLPIADTESSTLLAALRSGGHVLLFRHGATHADQAGTDPLNPDNVARQRHVNEQGIAFAREVGAKLRAQRVPVSEVYASSFQHTVETAELMGLGAVTASGGANGGKIISPNETMRRAEAFRVLCRRPLPAGSNRLIVSHRSTIVEAFGKDWLDMEEGEAAIFKVEPDGRCTPVARILPERWDKYFK